MSSRNALHSAQSNQGERMSDGARGCAVITGGAGGIGVAAARRLAARGLRIVLWDKNPAAAELAGTLQAAFALEVDVTDPASVAAAAEQTLAQSGAIQVLVNAAGIT